MSLPPEYYLKRSALTIEDLQQINIRHATTLLQLVELHNDLPFRHRTEKIILLACKMGISNFYHLIKYLPV